MTTVNLKPGDELIVTCDKGADGGDKTNLALFNASKKLLDLINTETYTTPATPGPLWREAVDDLTGEIYG